MDQAPPELPRGVVEVANPPSSRADHPAAVLWVPDPEQRHGWREFYVYTNDRVKPGAKRLGFS